MTKYSATPTIQEMKNSLSRIEQYVNEIKKIKIDEINNGNEPKLISITHKLDEFLLELYGNDSHQYDKYKYDFRIRLRSLQPLSPGECQLLVQRNISTALAALQCIKEIFEEKIKNSTELGSPEHVLKAYEGLHLHPDIANAVSKLFRDGHYASAIEQSVKALNGLVREKSNLKDDGVSLMQKAFSPNNPILKFNDLSDESDKNEQKGFMEWFTGTVTGLRNPRAHKIIKDDPEMALEFIAFVSLQAKLVDKSNN